MSTKKTVEFTVQARYQVHGEIELTEAEFKEWCDKIDSARGFEQERAAQELCEVAGISYLDGDIDDDEVFEFNWK